MIIRKLRLEQGWTQQELAQYGGLSIRTVQCIEKGQLPAKKQQSAWVRCLVWNLRISWITTPITNSPQTMGAVRSSTP